MRIKRIIGATVVALGVAATPSFAATLNVVGGQLMGASGVDVGGALYNVEFVDGSCAALFDGCDEVSDFTFQTEAAATLASQALLDQVFIDGPDGDFDSDTSLTNGVEVNDLAYILNPYGIPSLGNMLNVQSLNFSATDGRTDYVTGPLTRLATNGDPSSAAATYAVFSVAPIPLPAGGALLLTGLVGIAGVSRLRKRAT